MNETDAIAFLNAHQPLTHDDALNEDTLASVGALVEYYRHNQKPEHLSLIFGMKGETDAAGWFEELQNILISSFPRQPLLLEIERNLRNAVSDSGSALWAATLTWDIHPVEAMRICRLVYQDVGPATRAQLAYAIVLTANSTDVPWIQDLIRKENNEEARLTLNKAIERLHES